MWAFAGVGLWVWDFASACEPSRGAEVPRGAPPLRRPRAPRCHRDRRTRSLIVNGSLRVRESAHRARAPPLCCPPRHAPVAGARPHMGKAALPDVSSLARETTRRSLDSRPARLASAIGLLRVSVACPCRAAKRASRLAATQTLGRQRQRVALRILSAAHASRILAPRLACSRPFEAHTMPLSVRCGRCLSPQAVVHRAAGESVALSSGSAASSKRSSSCSPSVSRW